ncbi:MAG: FecCD family ABC transporter permease [Flavobacteriales bacterium]
MERLIPSPRTYFTRSTVLLLLISSLLILVGCSIGTVSIPFSKSLQILLGQSVDSVETSIILESRLPRTLGAFLAGGALGMAGLLMQTLFRNPLAGPSILGISSGASLGVAILVLSGSFFGWQLQSNLGLVPLVSAAIVGALGILFLMLLFASRLRDQTTLLIAGVMVGHFTGALESILQFNSSDSSIRTFVLWGMGSFANMQWSHWLIIGLTLLSSAMLIFPKLIQLNILLLGAEYAQTMGVSVKRVRLLLIFLSGIPAAMVTAFCGPIAFIGLIVPHLARLVLKTSDHRIIFIPIIFIGGIVGVLSDILSRLGEVPLNAITSALGAPIVVYLLMRKNRQIATV